jgi:hypothetical protein
MHINVFNDELFMTAARNFRWPSNAFLWIRRISLAGCGNVCGPTF